MTSTQMNAAESVFGSAARAFPPAGPALFSGATVDNTTGDPSFQVARTRRAEGDVT
jgi:hypothetical protein